MCVERANATATRGAAGSTSSSTRCQTARAVGFVSGVDITRQEDIVTTVSADITETPANRLLTRTPAQVAYTCNY